ncbi:MAG TPA: RDD family protein [Mycobacteriales bacterium]|nr:RDD family protein [Mycobacteriales bacterium]
MTQPQDPSQPPPYGAPPPPPPPPYGAPPPPPPPAYGAPQYGAPQYGGYPQGYGPPPGQRVNDPAPMGMRLLARIIDGIILFAVIVPIVLASGLADTSSGNGSASFSIGGANYFKALLIGLAVSGAYEVTMLATRGATVGKMAVGVRVAMLETGQKPTAQAALVRWGIPGVAGIIPTGLLGLIVYLSPFFDSSHRNRGWYDYAAKTIAVRTR